VQFRSLNIANFRGIKRFSISGLSDFVLIAGPNGCGKSCVFDAIRLLKSLYGGYSPNEYHHFFGELQIDMNRPADIRRLFRNPAAPIEISATLQLSESERDYLRGNANALIEPVVWSELTGQDLAFRRFAPAAIARQSPEMMQRVAQQVAQRIPPFQAALNDDVQSVGLTLHHETLAIQLLPNPVVPVLFGTYDPEAVGVIEYHSASRTYQREALGGIDLNVRNFDDQRRQSTLYNWQNK
jgi:energy-coupling factor transporter ATP-binding protein EcfA2